MERTNLESGRIFAKSGSASICIMNNPIQQDVLVLFDLHIVYASMNRYVTGSNPKKLFATQKVLEDPFIVC